MIPPRWNWPLGLVLIAVIAVATFFVLELLVEG